MADFGGVGQAAEELLALGLKSEITSAGNLENALKKYLSPTEIAVLEKRLAITVMLEKKRSYLDIRRELDASPSTVSYVKQGFKINKKLPRVRTVLVVESENRRKRKFQRYKGTGGFGLAEW